MCDIIPGYLIWYLKYPFLKEYFRSNSWDTDGSVCDWHTQGSKVAQRIWKVFLLIPLLAPAASFEKSRLRDVKGFQTFSSNDKYDKKRFMHPLHAIKEWDSSWRQRFYLARKDKARKDAQLLKYILLTWIYQTGLLFMCISKQTYLLI